jgi:NADPH2:quinone reductase
MKAVVVHDFGGPDQLVVGEAADPPPGPGQIRIAVHAAGTNPVDAGNRADGSWAGLTTPYIPGYDIAGVVDELGSGVTSFAVGDRVMAMTHFPSGGGGYAELAVVSADNAARLHPATTFVEAAATPLAGGTALTVLARLGLAPNARLLVIGASGGVGLFLLQLAAAQGLATIAIGRQEMHDRMSDLGASACIDYASEDLTQRAVELANSPVDAVADLVGGNLLQSVLAALRPYGSVATIATPLLDLDPVLDNNITLHGVLINDDGERTRRLAAMLADGTLQPAISHVLPLADASEAHRILERHHTGGKLVLRVSA